MHRRPSRPTLSLCEYYNIYGFTPKSKLGTNPQPQFWLVFTTTESLGTSDGNRSSLLPAPRCLRWWLLMWKTSQIRSVDIITPSSSSAARMRRRRAIFPKDLVTKDSWVTQPSVGTVRWLVGRQMESLAEVRFREFTIWRHKIRLMCFITFYFAEQKKTLTGQLKKIEHFVLQNVAK